MFKSGLEVTLHSVYKTGRKLHKQKHKGQKREQYPRGQTSNNQTRYVPIRNTWILLIPSVYYATKLSQTLVANMNLES